MRDWDLLKNCYGDQCPKLAIPESLPASDSCPCPFLPVLLWLSCLPPAPQRLTCQHLLPSLKHWSSHVVCLASGLQQPPAEAAWGSPLQGVLTLLTYSSIIGMP